MPSDIGTRTVSEKCGLSKDTLDQALSRPVEAIKMDRQDHQFDAPFSGCGANGTAETSVQPPTERREPEAEAYRYFEAVPRENSGRSVEVGEPTKGTFLDETIGLRDPEGGAFTSAVMEIVLGERAAGRERQARYVEQDRNLIGCMLANGLRCHWHRQPPIVSYFRKADAYSAKPNKPVWLSGPALSRQSELLASTGQVRLFKGERETASGYEVTGQLVDLADRHGVTIHSLRRSFDREDLVRLKKVRPKSTFDKFGQKLVRHKGGRIYFGPTEETEPWRDELTAINDFLADHNIEVQVPEQLNRLWIDNLNDDEAHSGALFYKPELFRNAVYRVFNDGRGDDPRFDRGGRLAGGWWMNAPREVRPFITINGQPTIERDYEACHPRMLYHERGLECLHDPYDIPEVAELYQAADLTSRECRDAVKWIFQVLINGKRRPSRKDQPSDVVLPTEVKPLEIARMVEQTHEAIADAFRTGDGLRLMRLESDIAMAVIKRARECSFLALSLHDSFACPTDKQDILDMIMKEEYYKIFKQQPIIK